VTCNISLNTATLIASLRHASCQCDIGSDQYVLHCRMFGMVVEKLFMADLQKVSGNVDRKICAVGVTKILTEAPAMLQADYVKLWSVE